MKIKFYNLCFVYAWFESVLLDVVFDRRPQRQPDIATCYAGNIVSHPGGGSLCQLCVCVCVCAD